MKKQTLWRIVLALYLCVMVYLLFLQRIRYVDLTLHTYREVLKSNLNLVPFVSIENFIRNLFAGDPYWAHHAIVNLVGNVFMFVPAGFLLPQVSVKLSSLKKLLFFCLMSLMVVETVQLFTLLGSFDVDDVLLNVIGILIGFWLYKACQKDREE